MVRFTNLMDANKVIRIDVKSVEDTTNNAPENTTEINDVSVNNSAKYISRFNSDTLKVSDLDKLLDRDFASELQDNVVELDFSFNDDSSNRKDSIYTPSEHFENKSLNPYEHRKLDLQDAAYIADALRKNQSITKISLRNQNIGDNGVYYILKALYDNNGNKVKSLDLSDTNITEDSIALIYYFLVINQGTLKLKSILNSSHELTRNLLDIFRHIFIGNKLFSQEVLILDQIKDIAEKFEKICAFDKSEKLFMNSANNKLIVFYNLNIHDYRQLVNSIELRKDSMFDLKLAEFLSNRYDELRKRYANTDSNENSKFADEIVKAKKDIMTLVNIGETHLYKYSDDERQSIEELIRDFKIKHPDIFNEQPSKLSEEVPKSILKASSRVSDEFLDSDQENIGFCARLKKIFCGCC